MSTFRHLLLIIGAIPFIPYLLFKGSSIRKKVPKLLPPIDIKGSFGKSHEEINLLCIGESTIAGIGVDSHKDGMSGQLAIYLSKAIKKKINWCVFAKSGLTTKEIASKLNDEAIGFNPDIIVIGIGANDGFHLNSPVIFRKSSVTIIELLQDRFQSKPIVFANMPPISLFPAFPGLIKFFVANTVDIYREELSKIVLKFHNVYFDDRKIEAMNWEMNDKPITDFFSDGVHPSKLTYKLWSESVSKFILEKNIL